MSEALRACIRCGHSGVRIRIITDYFISGHDRYFFSITNVSGADDKMCTLMQKDVLAENLAEAAAFIGRRLGGAEEEPIEFRMCGLLRYFLLTHDADELDYDALCMDIAALRSRFEAKPEVKAEGDDISLTAASIILRMYLTGLGAHKDRSPAGAVLGGQPGAGKSGLTGWFLKRYPDAISINADEYRCWHPDYQRFQKELGKESDKATAGFSGKVASELLRMAAEERLNAAIEGTFRTSEVPLGTLRLYKSHGFTTYVLIKTCPAAMSWQHCTERYDYALKDNGGKERFTDRKIHDYVVSVLGRNADEVFKSGLADHFYVFDRNNAILYSSDSGSGDSLPSAAIERELGS